MVEQKRKVADDLELWTSVATTIADDMFCSLLNSAEDFRCTYRSTAFAGFIGYEPKSLPGFMFCYIEGTFAALLPTTIDTVADHKTFESFKHRDYHQRNKNYVTLSEIDFRDILDSL